MIDELPKKYKNVFNFNFNIKKLFFYQGDVSGAFAGTTLRDIINFEKRQAIPSIFLKIVQLKHRRVILTRGGKRMTLCQAIVKDVRGEKNKLSLWGPFMERVETGKVYQFEKL
jgi:hypothetical protein